MTVHHGHENKSLEAEEVTEQTGFQNELHQTSTRIQQTPLTNRRIPYRRIHRIRFGRWIIRCHPGRPRTVERGERILVRLSRRHQQSDDSGSSLHNADLRTMNPGSLHDVHEHTLCLSSQTRIRIPSIRNDHGSNIHCIHVLPHLRQDRPTLSPSSEYSPTFWTKAMLSTVRLLSTQRANPRHDSAINRQSLAKPGSTMIPTGFDHAAILH